MSTRALVLDANILIRAALGRRVLAIIESHAREVRLCAPDVAYADAHRYLPAVLARRQLPMDFLNVLRQLETSVQSLPASDYAMHRKESERRIAARDIDDWPVVACALMLECPIWTEDADFFGTGVATWTTDRVALYLNNPPSP